MNSIWMVWERVDQRSKMRRNDKHCRIDHKWALAAGEREAACRRHGHSTQRERGKRGGERRPLSEDAARF